MSDVLYADIEPTSMTLEERIEMLEREVMMLGDFVRTLAQILIARNITSWDEIKRWDEVDTE